MNPNESEIKTSRSVDWKNVLTILGIFVGGVALGIVSQHLNRNHPPSMAGGQGPKGGPGFQARDDRGPGESRPHFGGQQGGERQDHSRFSREDDKGERGPRMGDGPREPSPEMKEYAEKVKGVLEPYKTKIESVLTAEQKEKLASGPGGPGERKENGSAPDDRKGPGMQRGGGPRGPEPLMGLVIYKPALDRMSEHLSLNDKQKTQVEKIMVERRDALLKFVDQNPPPAPDGKPRKQA